MCIITFGDPEFNRFLAYQREYAHMARDECYYYICDSFWGHGQLQCRVVVLRLPFLHKKNFWLQKSKKIIQSNL